MGGEWLLKRDGDHTHVTYTWNAELGGSLPEWTYATAYRRAGFGGLKELASFSDAELLDP